MASSDFLARIKLALEGKEKVVAGLAETQRAAQNLTKTKVTTIFDKEGLATGKQIEETFAGVGKETGKSFQAMGDFEKALRRVVLVAPVWMAFRAVLQQTFALISDGFRVWEEFDRILIKSKAVIHDFSGTTDQAMTELEGTIRSFSKESGISLDQLASSFYRFGTVGVAFSDALSGAIASAKLAKATLGDVDTISRSLAMTYRLLGDTIDQTLSPMEKQESLAGKIFHLWKTNAFEANEFSSSLNNFVSTANIANFTTDQTIALLSALGTAGVQGSRGGTLLKTAIQKLVENLDKLAPKLGLAVNPELETTFSLFMRVLGSINELSKTKGIPAEALKSIQEIFGGVRGGQVVSALNALLPELKTNLEDLGRDPQEFIKGLDERFKEVNDTVSGQLDIFKRLREQVGEAFVKGVVGANDFKDSLRTINDVMEGMIDVSNRIGRFLAFTVNPVGVIKSDIKDINDDWDAWAKRLEDAEAGLLDTADIIEVMAEVSKRMGDDAFTKDLINRLNQVRIQVSETAQLQERLDKAVEDYNTNVIQSVKKEEERGSQLSLELQDRLASADAEVRALTLQKAGTDDLVIAHIKLNGLVDNLVDRHNSLIDASGKQVEQLSKQDVIAAVLKGDFEKIQEIFKGMTLDEKEINSLAESYININKSILSDLGDRLSKMTSILKIAGEEESAIVRQEMAMKALIFGEDYLNNSMDDRLKLAQALTKEADEQEKSSSRLVELFKIAQKYGKQVAQEVSEFLGGMKEFSTLSPQAVQALRKTLPGEFQTAQAQQFFQTQAPGFAFPEEITAERRRQRNIQILENVMIEPIQINVALESEQVIEKVKDAIIKELDDKKSELSKKINNQIEQF
jgi:TP901 family phage tail tape measure protein